MGPVSSSLGRCELCPRRCGVDRLSGRAGYCGAGSEAQVFRSGVHHGEEPPISGSRGSGTVFFSRCTLRCLYCQNYPWSQEGRGEERGTGELAQMLGDLRDAGCHNWNLVSPTPWLPMIREALSVLGGERLPLVYNTSGFERVETLEAYGDLADIFLTDLRYARAETAREGSGAADYVEIARQAVAWMWRARGPLETDGDGTARRGVICRLLVLPGHEGEAIENLRWLARTVGTGVAVSVMSQYRPAHRAVHTAPWNARPDAGEYRRVCGAAEELGFDNGWLQDYGGEPDRGLIGYEMPSGALAR